MNTIDMATRERAAQLFRASLVADMTLPGMFSELNDMFTLERYRGCGIALVSLTLANDTVGAPELVLARARKVVAEVARNQATLSRVSSASDAMHAHGSGKLGIAFNLQGTNALAGDVRNVSVLREIGVTHMLLAYNVRNAAGGGCVDASDDGLTHFGRMLVDEMNRCGVLVDGSHTGRRTSLEAMERARQPFIFSHSNACSVYAHYRNITDEQIRACAATDGVIGINGVGAFLSPDGVADAQTIFRHIDHVVALVGARHAGFGLDFITDTKRFAARARESASEWPTNDGRVVAFDHFASPEALLEVTELMVQSGYRDEHVRAILGGNFMRVLACADSRRQSS